MPYQDPNNMSNWVLLAFSLILALWGSVASYLIKWTKGTIQFSILKLVAELIISGFACVMVYMLCMYFELQPVVCAFLGGMAGHTGAKTLTLLSSIHSAVVRRLPDKKL